METPTRLAVAWSEEVPTPLLREMERHARRMGLPMDTMEVLGLDAGICRDFVRHAEAGGADLFLTDLNPDAVRALVAERRRAVLTVFDDAAFVY